MRKYHCVRVYANGDAKETWRDEEGMKSWLEYNRTARPGCSRFINGVPDSYKHNGYLAPVLIRKISSILKKEYPVRVKTAVLDTIGAQKEYSGPMRAMSWDYVGYKPEVERRMNTFHRWVSFFQAKEKQKDDRRTLRQAG